MHRSQRAHLWLTAARMTQSRARCTAAVHGIPQLPRASGGKHPRAPISPCALACAALLARWQRCAWSAVSGRWSALSQPNATLRAENRGETLAPQRSSGCTWRTALGRNVSTRTNASDWWRCAGVVSSTARGSALRLQIQHALDAALSATTLAAPARCAALPRAPLLTCCRI